MYDYGLYHGELGEQFFVLTVISSYHGVITKMEKNVLGDTFTMYL